MNQIETIRALYDQQERIEAEFPLARKEVAAPVVRHINRPGRRSFILHSDLAGHDADAVIEREIAYFGALGLDVEWKAFSHDAPPDLVNRLVAHGFEPEDEETLMVLPLASLPARLAAPVSTDIRRLTHDAEFESFAAEIRSILEQVWGTPFDWIREHLHDQVAINPRLISIYIAYVDGIPASSAWVNFPEKSTFASLFGGSTLEAHRGKGLYTALVAVRAQESLARGYQYLTVDCSPMSRAVLEKQGFLPVATATACVKKAAG
ncbi:MAG: hypothetical protein KME04_11525 [Pleurocapsa minor GSE-CHR-MK-17-07R]|jgi:hypothetical protein|nr:hypothetical protein [Pleurocapsa minor GSE-CHR-MK 17-07R]